MSAPADKYFGRRAPWRWHNDGQIDVLDDRHDVVATLDEWETLVFHEAEGHRTVGELIASTAEQFRGKAPVPPDLEETISKALRRLVEELNAVELTDEWEALRDEHNLPVDEQEPAS